MATQAATPITRTITGLKGTALNLGGLPAEVFVVASGAAPGDTAVLVPSTFTNVRGVIGPGGNNLPSTGVGASNVTVTIPAMGATGATVPATQWIIFGPLPMGPPA
jgi:hypothetical protein